MTLSVYCGPMKRLKGEADVLYHNNGDGTFTDVTKRRRHQRPGYYGFGVLFTDLDDDGWPDIYVGERFERRTCCFTTTATARSPKTGPRAGVALERQRPRAGGNGRRCGGLRQ